MVQGKSGNCLRVLRLINKGIKGAQTKTYKQTSKEQDLWEAVKLSSNLGGCGYGDGGQNEKRPCYFYWH